METSDFRWWHYFFSSCLLAVSFSVSGQITSVIEEEYPSPPDMSSLHFYLITVDVGEDVWNNFGHTALRLFDESSNTDTIYNWGVFDISGGVLGFSWDFFTGVMDYRLSLSSPSREFASYAAQGRTVWQDKINLTNPQKERLYQRLMWNIEPSNVEYPYQYFFNNCTTKLRDYLDEALDGKISSQFAENVGFTFRDHVQSHYQSVGFVALSLDILMNSNIDRVISEWEQMFLPLQFRGYLRQMVSDVAENGERQMLLSDSQTILDFSPPTIETNPYQIASALLFSPLLFLLLMVKRIPQSYYANYSNLGLRWASLTWRLLGLLGLIMMGFSGIYGLLMLGSWFISDHLDTHHNLNLLLFWPTDILGLVMGFRWLFTCKPWPMTHNNEPFINYYLLAHLVGITVYGGLAFFDLSAQSINNVALYILPSIFLFTLLIWFVGFESAKNKNSFF
ncbi:MAG: DUF4105 domain-containing protein [Gammaproteobacteria bacterium]|nr:DUF4105 domain-containing protein [Gammaproteobacteria bacterium]